MINQVDQTEKSRTAPNLYNTLRVSVILNWEKIAYIGLFVLAVLTRFADLGVRIMSHDESLHTKYSWNLYTQGNYQHMPMMHGPLLFHMTALSYWLFGDNDFAGRVYPAVLGVLIVMMPVLFRKYLGRFGALITSLMLLISPYMMYYSRYIRHDIPAIFFALIMFYCFFRYTETKRERWLFVLAGALSLLIASKELGFFYVAIFGSFLTLYAVVRLVQKLKFQSAGRAPGRVWFYVITSGALMGLVFGLLVIVMLSIIPPDTVLGEAATYNQALLGQLLSWLVALIVVTAIIITAVVYGQYRGLSFKNWPVSEVLAMVGIMAIVVVGMVFVEELSRHPTSPEVEVAEPADPTAEGVEETAPAVNRDFIVIAAAIGVAALVVVMMFAAHTMGWWETIRDLPEWDVLFTMGTLVLPFVTPLLLTIMGANPTDYSPQGVQRAALALVPFAIVTISVGLSWRWKTFLVVAGVFFALFVFFFTTMFTNGTGLASGMIGSLGYWLEQQGVRRGSQPQYYYILLQLPLYEFLPLIGSLMAGLAGFGGLFRYLRRRARHEMLDAESDAPVENVRAAVILTARSPLEALRDSLVERYPALADAEILHQFASTVPEAPTDEVFYTLIDAAETQGIPDSARAFGYRVESIRGDGAPPEDEEIIAVAWLEAEPETEPTAEIAEIETETAIKIARLRSYGRLTAVPFVLFIVYWALMSVFAYTLAGEKMPWLTTHLTLPMIFLAGWWIGGLLEKVDFGWLREKGWWLLIVLPVMSGALIRIVGGVFDPKLVPFRGETVLELSATGGWLGAVLIFALSVGVIVWMVWRDRQLDMKALRNVGRLAVLTFFAFLGVATARAAYTASFINYDHANEFLVYAHAGTGNGLAMEQIEELSLRATDDLDLVVAFDDEMTWPISWYLRDYPNQKYFGKSPSVQTFEDAVVIMAGDSNWGKVEPLIGDRYYEFRYNRMVWPIQDYWNLNGTRVIELLDFSDPNHALKRKALWDIFWGRDYETYSQLLGKEISLSDWPVSQDMKLYVRKDYAAQIWNLGVGAVPIIGEEGLVDPYGDGYSLRPADTFWGLSGSGEAQLQQPRGIAVGPDGRVYVADSGNSRIQVYAPDGTHLFSFGRYGTTQNSQVEIPGDYVNQPEGIAVGPDGRVYVADTWNHRVQVFSAEGEWIKEWGRYFELGESAYALWGPRDVEVDAEGRVYVADTGGKRIRVYSADGDWLRDIGEPGGLDGQVSEPVGLAISDAGELFVADTWNKRIQVFDLQGNYLRKWDVNAWYDELGHRPYLAIDSNNRLWVTDPDACRVLIFDLGGTYLESFGQCGDSPLEAYQFQTIGGIAAGEDAVFLTDLGASRVVRFDVLPVAETVPDDRDVIEEVEEGAGDSGENPSPTPLDDDDDDDGSTDGTESSDEAEDVLPTNTPSPTATPEEEPAEELQEGETDE